MARRRGAAHHDHGRGAGLDGQDARRWSSRAPTPRCPGGGTTACALPFTVWLQQQLPGGNTFVLFMACSPISQKQCRSFTFNARNFALDEDDERFIRFQQEIAEADRVISESQTPEELPFDMTAELYIRGVDRLSIEYRRWLFEVARASTDG